MSQTRTHDPSETILLPSYLVAWYKGQRYRFGFPEHLARERMEHRFAILGREEGDTDEPEVVWTKHPDPKSAEEARARPGD